MARSNKAPDHKDDNGSYDRADEPGAFTGVIPADCLPQVGGDKRPHDSEDGSEDKARGLVRAGVKKFCDNTSNEADDNGPRMLIQNLRALRPILRRSRRSLMDCTPSLERQSRNTSYARLYSLIFR